MDRCSMSMPLMVFMMLGMTVISLVDAQALPNCANQLLPCMDYLNSTNTPPDICCNPIKDLDATQRTCLCQLALSPDILEGFGINVSQALRVVHACGVNFDVSFCKASSSALPPSSVQPPATPGGDEGGAGRITSTGLGFLLFIWTYVFFHHESGVYPSET